MTTTYVLGPTNSDLTGPDHSKQLDDTAVGGSTLTWTKPASGVEEIWGVAPVGVPGAQGVTGDYTVKFNIVTGIDAGSTVRVKVRRRTAAGATTDSPFTATQLATAGPKTFFLPTVTLLTWGDGDRLVVIYEWAGGGTMGNVSLGFQVGTTAAEVIAPWDAAAPAIIIAVPADAAADAPSPAVLIEQPAIITAVAASATADFPAPLVEIEQIARPTADANVGGWITDTGATTNLFQAIDEPAPASDADYVQSPIDPTAAVYVCQLGSLSDPGVSRGHQFRYRYRKSGTATIDLTVELRQGYTSEVALGTLIRQWVHTGIGDTEVTAMQTLADAEADAITSYGALAMRFVADRPA